MVSEWFSKGGISGRKRSRLADLEEAERADEQRRREEEEKAMPSPIPKVYGSWGYDNLGIR